MNHIVVSYALGAPYYLRSARDNKCSWTNKREHARRYAMKIDALAAAAHAGDMAPTVIEVLQ